MWASSQNIVGPAARSIQLGLTAPIITVTAKGDASQQHQLWATAHSITCG
jgi:hypothetical protein